MRRRAAEGRALGCVFELVLTRSLAQLGEYSFCFANEASNTDKLIDFDIMVESEPRRTLGGSAAPLKEHTSALEESTYKLSGLLSSITRTQKYFHTRHHRNYSTVQSTKSRMFWFTVLECVAIVAMALWVESNCGGAQLTRRQVANLDPQDVLLARLKVGCDV